MSKVENIPPHVFETQIRQVGNVFSEKLNPPKNYVTILMPEDSIKECKKDTWLNSRNCDV